MAFTPERVTSRGSTVFGSPLSVQALELNRAGGQVAASLGTAKLEFLQTGRQARRGRSSKERFEQDEAEKLLSECVGVAKESERVGHELDVLADMREISRRRREADPCRESPERSNMYLVARWATLAVGIRLKTQA